MAIPRTIPRPTRRARRSSSSGAAGSSVAAGAVLGAASSFPSQVFSAGLVLLGGALLLYGYKLVRPVNFAAGAYLGGTLSLLLLKLVNNILLRSIPIFANLGLIRSASAAQNTNRLLRK